MRKKKLGEQGFLIVLILAGIAAVAAAVFVGHLFPVFFRFKGGKGVATAAGILLAMDWRIGLSVLVISTFMVTRAFEEVLNPRLRRR